MRTEIVTTLVKLWCEECGRWTKADTVTFGGHFVDVTCEDCKKTTPYNLTLQDNAPPTDETEDD